MRLKRYIALLTAAIYCFAIVAPAHASVTCECVTRGAAAAHACCTHCLGGDCSPEGVHIAAPCCDDRHSTEIALYTFASEEDNAPVRRIAALDLPEALAAESTATLPRLRVLPPDSGGARPLSAYAPPLRAARTARIGLRTDCTGRPERARRRVFNR